MVLFGNVYFNVLLFAFSLSNSFEKHAKTKACQEKEMSTKEVSKGRGFKSKSCQDKEMERKRNVWEQEMSGERSGKRCQENEVKAMSSHTAVIANGPKLLRLIAALDRDFLS